MSPLSDRVARSRRPTSQANGTYGRLGAPIRMENMNLHRHGYYGGGPSLDVGAATRLARPLRPARINKDRFAYQNHSYAWYLLPESFFFFSLDTRSRRRSENIVATLPIVGFT